MPSRLTVLLVSLLLAIPTLAFWLCLVTVPAVVAILCPEECECATGGYLIICKDILINPIPLIPLTYVRYLWLYKNKVTLLKKDSFVSLTELIFLRI